MKIYADNAATTQLDKDAFEAMKPFLLEEYANPSQPYSFSRKSKRALKEARETIAECIHANPEEIYFTSGGTEGNNWTVKGTLQYGDDRTVITSQIEHHSLLNPCAALEKFQYPVVYLPVSQQGIVMPETLESAINQETRLVSIMTANNEIGTVQPIKELAEIAHAHGAVFHTDAVQAVGHIPIDVQKLGIDMLSASGHKFNAPKGIGFLYSRNKLLQPFHDGGSQESGMRAGTENVASIVAMAIALKKNYHNMDMNHQKLISMENEFVKILNQSGIDYIRNGAENHIAGNISISIRHASGEMLLHRLDLKGICISTGSACDSVNTQISHVIRAVGVPKEYAEGTIRISFGVMNQSEDAVSVAQTIVNILKK